MRVKIISRRAHGIADYLLVVIFLSLPAALGFTGVPRVLSYAFAFIHLLVTGFSSFPPGSFRVIAVPVHKIAEIVAGIFLILSPWLLRFADSPAPRNSFIIIGLALLVLALATDFDRRKRGVPPPPDDRRRRYSRRR